MSAIGRRPYEKNPNTTAARNIISTATGRWVTKLVVGPAAGSGAPGEPADGLAAGGRESGLTVTSPLAPGHRRRDRSSPPDRPAGGPGRRPSGQPGRPR